MAIFEEYGAFKGKYITLVFTNGQRRAVRKLHGCAD